MLDIDGDWGIEQLSDGNQIRWKIAFYKKPIDEEDTRLTEHAMGIHVYRNDASIAWSWIDLSDPPLVATGHHQ